MNKKEKISIIIEKLKNIYPDTRCTLDYDEAYKLLISVRLAAQCTDVRVNQTVPDLFAAYPTIDALAIADVDAVESIIRPCGLGKSKAHDIVACMQMLRDIYNYHVPDTMEELLKLPGVGRKSANLILGDIYGKPAIVTDTHCIRLSNRLGLSKSTLPAKVEQDLRRIVPPSEGNALCHRFVDHGRAVCTARNPHCDDCTLRDICSTPANTLPR
ncbi:MAG: endonuclease III [Lachnospiraceae bacterium]|nr:endonuclease III [Lachnospiraceae bacterium]